MNQFFPYIENSLVHRSTQGAHSVAVSAARLTWLIHLTVWSFADKHRGLLRDVTWGQTGRATFVEPVT